MASWIQLHWRIWLLVPLALDHLALAEDLKPTRWPLYPQKPLVLVWKPPTEDCRPRHTSSTSSSISFRSWPIRMKASPSRTSPCSTKTRLGLYPHFQDGVAVNGGLPQIASLTHHREKMPEGIAKVHSWRVCTRPGACDRLGGMASDLDTELGHQSHLQEPVAALSGPEKPSWTPTQITKVAQQDFEISSRIFRLETFTSGQKLASKPALGCYLFLTAITMTIFAVWRTTRDAVRMWRWPGTTSWSGCGLKARLCFHPYTWSPCCVRHPPLASSSETGVWKEGMRLASVGEDWHVLFLSNQPPLRMTMSWNCWQRWFVEIALDLQWQETTILTYWYLPKLHPPYLLLVTSDRLYRTSHRSELKSSSKLCKTTESSTHSLDVILMKARIKCNIAKYIYQGDFL